MIAALDVHYDESTLAATAAAAAVVFRQWEDAEPVAQYAARCTGIEPYVPGQFFKRELPCLLAVLEKVREPLDFIVIDGYVSLGAQPGLGMHLWEALQRAMPVIGVAKTRFVSADPLEVTRGQSDSPLFVTAIGVEAATVAENIARMHGPFRIPTLLKRVDQLARA
jgi:deoxyribonuclease V